MKILGKRAVAFRSMGGPATPPLAVLRVAIPNAPPAKPEHDTLRTLARVDDYFRALPGPTVHVNPSLSPVLTVPLPPKDPKNHYNQYAAFFNKVVTEAVAQGFDFKPFVNAKTGEVDGLVFLHTAVDEERALQDGGILSHAAIFDPPLTVNALRFRSYVTFSEQSVFGTLCHELGHLFWDWPDLYDTTDPDPKGGIRFGVSSGLGNWCLMATGGALASPPAPSAYVFALGDPWPAPRIAATGNIKIKPILQGGSALRFAHDPTASEYFLVEARQSQGPDAALPGSGVLVYHANDAINDNTNPFAPRVRLLQADRKGYLELGDVGTPGNAATAESATLVGTNAFLDSVLQDGTASGVTISNVTFDGASGNASFQLALDAPRARASLAGTSGKAQLNIATQDADMYQGSASNALWSRYRFDGEASESLVAYGVEGTLSFWRPDPDGTIHLTGNDFVHALSKHGSLHAGRFGTPTGNPDLLTFDPASGMVRVYAIGARAQLKTDLDVSDQGTFGSACVGRFLGGTSHDDLLVYSPFRQKALLYRVNAKGKLELYGEATLRRRPDSPERWRSTVTVRTPGEAHDHIALHDYEQTLLDIWKPATKAGVTSLMPALAASPLPMGAWKTLAAGRFIDTDRHDALALWDPDTSTLNFFSIDFAAGQCIDVGSWTMWNSWASIVAGHFDGTGQDGLFFHAR